MFGGEFELRLFVAELSELSYYIEELLIKENIQQKYSV